MELWEKVMLASQLAIPGGACFWVAGADHSAQELPEFGADQVYAGCAPELTLPG